MVGRKDMQFFNLSQLMGTCCTCIINYWFQVELRLTCVLKHGLHSGPPQSMSVSFVFNATL